MISTSIASISTSISITSTSTSITSTSIASTSTSTTSTTSPDYVTTFLGASEAGLTITTLNPIYTPRMFLLIFLPFPLNPLLLSILPP